MNRIIVSGASSNHFKSLLQFINSVLINEPNIHIIIYDLDLTIAECEAVSNKLSHFEKSEFVKFDYSKYPSYYNIHINAGEYAWKSAIINHVALTYPNSLILWCDAGNVLSSPQDKLWNNLLTHHIGSTTTSGNIRKWTHPKCLEYFNIPIDSYFLNYRNKNGALLAFNTSNPIVKDFINEWYTCCAMKECIAPEGSSRENHRQDQAVFTVLYYKYVEKYNIGNMDNSFNIKIHQDID